MLSFLLFVNHAGNTIGENAYELTRFCAAFPICILLSQRGYDVHDARQFKHDISGCVARFMKSPKMVFLAK